ncbi:MAG: LysM peptidoglycan-binding domain-containing protein [Aggregatilineales bacterium]
MILRWFRIAIFISAVICGLGVFPSIAEEPIAVTVYVVQRGDTLFRIALRHNITVEALARLNGISNPNNIEVGQRLLVPAHPGETPVARYHRVQPGETLQSISQAYGLEPMLLAELNALQPDQEIVIGQYLNVLIAEIEPPAGGETSSFDETPLLSPPVVVHRVARGETLFRIAMAYGVTVNDLVAANTIADPTLIYAGQELIIPNVNPPQFAADLPEPVTGLSVTPLVLIEGKTGSFRVATRVPANATGVFLERQLQFAQEAGGLRHTALVGVPVGTPSGVYPLLITIAHAEGQAQIVANIQIVSGNYVVERDIILLEDRIGLLDPVVEEAEQVILRAVMTGFTSERWFDGPMGLPAAAAITSAFGNLRSYNGGQVQRIHAGTDFGGAPGTPIFAPAAGRVVMADTLNVRGVATVIDHGWGVYTGYWHKTDRYVQVGDIVQAGQVIGTIGATGRVSGPHLHWEMWVNGVPVDPMQWVIVNFS